MNFGNFNIKDLKLGNAQVASVWYGASKLWPIVSTVTIAAVPGEHVTSIIGTGTYNIGDTVCLAAEVETDFRFEGWYENDTLISTDNPYTFTAERNITFEATAVVIPAVDVILDRFVMPDPTNVTQLQVANIVATGVQDIETGRARWNDTTAIITYHNKITGVYEGVTEDLASQTLTAVSSPFPQNLTEEKVTRNVTFVAIDGNTYEAQVIQSGHVSAYFEITLSGISSYGFESAPQLMPNLDLNTYDGIYKSNNKGKGNTAAVARVDFVGIPELTIWINSNAESSWDYTVVGELDASTFPATNYNGYSGNGYSTESSSWDGKYSNTKSYQKKIDATASQPDTTRWRKIVIANDGGEHHIFINYLKDGSGDSNDDIGAFIIKNI